MQENISITDAKKAIDDGAAVIDVRTPKEYAEGHIPGSTNIDIHSEDFVHEIEALDKNETYVVNCQTGGRSSQAASYMKEHGFTDVYNLEGGIVAWKEKGFDTET